LCFLKTFVNHGGRRGNAAQALTQWRHPVASSASEDRDVLNWAIAPTLYCLICMATKIGRNLRLFFKIVAFVVANNLR